MIAFSARRMPHHGPDFHQAAICALGLRYPFDAPLLDLEPASEALGPRIPTVADFEALGRHGARLVLERSNFLHASGRTRLDIIVRLPHRYLLSRAVRSFPLVVL